MPLKTRLRRIASTLCLLAIAACTTPPQPAAVTPFEQDVIAATDGLAAQWRGKSTIRRPGPARRLALGPFVDLGGAPSRQAAAFAQPQSQASVKARQIVARHVETMLSDVKLVTPSPGSDTAADLLLSASLAPSAPADSRSSGKQQLMLTLVLLDIKTRAVVARWQSALRSESSDGFPSPYEAATPVLITQSASEARAAMFSAPIDSSVDAPTVGEAIGLSRLAQAQAAYSAGHYQMALALFQEVAARSPEQALRAYNGQYLTYTKLGQTQAAQQAFRQVVAAGFASKRLAVKLLFIPAQTEFWSEPEVSGAYGAWLREIAAQAAAAPSCLEIAGHTSRTGAEAFNLDLSMARSERVRQIMLANQARLAGRLQASGKGWTENIVGSGTDDARDAVDRRVEFRVADCKAAR